MKTSKDRILTTHTGSLPRPKPLIDLVMKRERGEMIDTAAFAAETAKAIDDIVAQQTAAGIDVVSDGEMSKPSYTTYIRHRVSGIEPDPRAAEKGRDIMIGRDLLGDDVVDRLGGLGGEGGSVDRRPAFAVDHEIDQRLRPRQAARMRRQDSVRACFHLVLPIAGR